MGGVRVFSPFWPVVVSQQKDCCEGDLASKFKNAWRGERNLRDSYIWTKVPSGEIGISGDTMSFVLVPKNFHFFLWRVFSGRPAGRPAFSVLVNGFWCYYGQWCFFVKKKLTRRMRLCKFSKYFMI